MWIETKVGKPLLRKEQYAWGIRRLNHGGDVWIIVLRDNDIHCYRTLPAKFKVEPYSKWLLILDAPMFIISKSSFNFNLLHT
jgi:hypothetical protein